MTTSSATHSASATAWRPRGTAGWLALAASPTFAVMAGAVMAGIAANDAHPMAICSSAAGILPIDGVTAMYLLMSLFHLSPWLKLAAGRPWAGN